MMAPVREKFYLIISSILSIWIVSEALAQKLDSSSQDTITITAMGGLDWEQAQQRVTAYQQAHATKGDAAVTANRIIAYYRKKQDIMVDKTKKSEKDTSSPNETISKNVSSSEIYRLDAMENVHIFNHENQIWGDKAIYDIDSGILLITGKNLKLTTPHETMTSADTIEYHSREHMSVGRGKATITTNDGRRIQADTLVGYNASTNVPQSTSFIEPTNLDKVFAYGHVFIHLPGEILTGDQGVYLPSTGLGRIQGNVRITRGSNHLEGSMAIFDSKNGLARIVQQNGQQVKGLFLPATVQSNSDKRRH